MPAGPFKNPSLVGLDIDGSHLAAVELDLAGQLRRAAAEPLPEGVVRDGEVADPDTLRDALARFFSSHSFPRKVWLGLSNQHVTVRQLELPVIPDEEQLATAIRFQASESIAMPLDEAILDFLVVSEGEGREGVPRMRVVVVVARRTMVDKLVTCVRQAGLKPQGIELDAFALVRALAGPEPVREHARVLCHLSEIANIAIALGDDCLFTRPIALSGQTGARAADAIAAGIRLSTDFYGSQPDARPVASVVVSGPGAEDAELRAALGERVSLPLDLPPPVHCLGPDGADGRLTVAAGLALGGAL